MTRPVTFRPATARDAAGIAALHAANWRVSYRGILSDAFLDGPVEIERQVLWRERLRAMRPGMVTILAEARTRLVGFGCLFLDEDPRWGSLIDNLHADPDFRRLGIGRELMRAMAARAVLGSPDRPVHLFCLERNSAARGFYERLGGVVAERCALDEPDGGRHPSLRYVWGSPAALETLCA